MAEPNTPYKPLFDYNRYPMMVLSAGPRGVEAFDEWMAGMGRFDDVKESDAEALLIVHWPEIVSGLGLQSDQLSAAQALFS